jgi:hypothetical protein
MGAHVPPPPPPTPIAFMRQCLARRGGVDDEVLRELCATGLPLGEIDLRECADITDDGCRSLACTADRIRSIDLQLAQQERVGITCDGLSTLLSRTKWLHTLKLNRCVLVDDRLCHHIVDSLRNLRLLSLCGCHRVSDDGVEALASIPTLFSLALSSTAVTDRGCLAIAEGRCARVLTELQLSKTEITDVGVIPLITNCLRLKNLLLDGVRGVTPECRERLKPPTNGRGYVSWTVY